MSHKKISPRDAAIAVLAKAEEMYKSSNLAKGDWAKIHSKLKREGYSEESADKIDGAIKAKVDDKKEIKKDDDGAQGMMMSEDAPKEEAPMKGHIKLAKFIGRMEQKRGKPAKEMDKSISNGSGAPSAETGHEKGINTRVDSRNPISISDAGRDARQAAKWTADKKAGIGSKKITGELAREHKNAAVEHHKQVLGEMKQMPKPKLPQEMDKAETGHEKGVNLQAPKHEAGISDAGLKATGSMRVQNSDVGGAKKAVIGRMMENSQIKPKLPG